MANPYKGILNKNTRKMLKDAESGTPKPAKPKKSVRGTPKGSRARGGRTRPSTGSK